MTDQEKAAGANQAANQNKQSDHTGNSANAQQLRLLKALRKGRVSTLSARRDLDILHPAARIQELRDRGYEIKTHWQTEFTDGGHEHRVAAYVLVREAHA